MQIYNITKERVTDIVNRAFDSKDIPKELCLCYQCRLDVTCYVLNRAKPIYVLSERGIAHLKDNYSNSLQDLADLTRLVENGITLISKAKRAHHLEPVESIVEKAEAYFNFPTITGSILSGETFAPIESKVTLILDDDPALMKDNKWDNPIQLTKSTNENYLFWPKAITSTKIGETKTFIFQVEIDSKDYEASPHFFELTLTSEENINDQFQAHLTHTCSNILLFKQD
ncbi:MAG: late competence development ComFB family protein [Spirochaetaceae bacterium]